MAKRPVVDFSVPEAQPFLLEGGEHGVLLLHGFTGSAGHMRPLGEALHAMGFTVMGINMPGHAITMEEMTRTGWQDWLGAAKEAFVQLRLRCRYASVAGLSMGGDLTLILAEQMDVTACAPIAAPMGTKNKLLPLSGLLYPFYPMVMWSNNPHRKNQLDPRYDLGYPGFYTRCGADLHHLIRMARRDLHAVRCPILAVQSHADETIAGYSADVIMQGVSSERKGILWLEEVPHVCTITREKDRITAAIAELFRSAEC